MVQIISGLMTGLLTCLITNYYTNRIKKKQIKFLYYLNIHSVSIICSYLSSYKINNTIVYVLLIFVCLLLLSIAIIDGLTMIIPNSLLCVLLLIVLGYAHLDSTISNGERLIGMFIVSLPMVMLNVLIMEMFGGGDIKLLVIIGYLLGYQQTILMIVLAIFMGGIYSSWIILVKKSKKKQYIPFAPYLCISILITMFFGEGIMYWYFSI